MNIAYTVFHSLEYNDEVLSDRSENVKYINENFKDIQKIENDVIIVNNLLSYKEALKKHVSLRKLKISGSMRFGAVGLLFTTFLAYEKMLDFNADVFLFFEDDAKLSENSFEIVQKYLAEVPADFDILSMYENKAFYKKYDKSYDFGLKNICFSYNDRSTLVYAISKKGMRNYFSLMKDKLDNPLDLYLFDKQKNTKMYAIKPNSDQPFYCTNFLKNGDPNYKNSGINKTDIFFFGDKK